MTIQQELEACFDRLWPIPRSITGAGVRKTHDIIGEIIPLTRHEFPSGSSVFDWTIPQEWAPRKAYIITPDGKKICDFSENNLHLVNYSKAYHGKLSLPELSNHLYSLPELPDAIPYITRYYQPDWGFCLPHSERVALTEGIYEVNIDAEFIDGSMTVSECLIPGISKKEILVHTYTCHPSMAVNELSGPLVTAFLARKILSEGDNYYSYRFVFTPETIGAIAYLSLRGSELKENMIAGYVCTCVGHSERITYKKSKLGNTLADRAAAHVLTLRDDAAVEIRNFQPSGSDERQYCSLGFNLPVGSLMRIPYGEYPEYHTSLDNKKIIDFAALEDTVGLYLEIFSVIEENARFMLLKPCGEPQLSKYIDFYGTRNHRIANTQTLAAKWLIHYCDGDHDLLTISQKSRIPLNTLRHVADLLSSANLLKMLN